MTLAKSSKKKDFLQKFEKYTHKLNFRETIIFLV